jgi:2-octaprenyl-6-methoxyphenol hydroxylase
MARQKVDIAISGGGVAGLAAAAAFGAEGFSILCVDPAPPVTAEGDAGADLRTTAFLQPSVEVLERAGIWPRLAPHATALGVMRIVDAGGPDGSARVVRDFEAADISDRPFGWNLPNWLIRREIVAHLATLPGVEFAPGVATRSVLTREGAAIIGLSDGRNIEARLLIGADGRDSAVREAVGIGSRTLRYGQKALVFAVTHPIPHGNVSTEVHRSGGPFTLVPLPDRDGRPASAVVWMERGPEALRLAALPEAAFEAEATARSAHLYGPLRLAGRRGVWPIISRLADAMTAERTALMAEAAHVVPPIGAQGLNMSLGDLRVLVGLATADRAGLGGPEMLAAYARARHPEVAARVAGIDLLNRASMAGAQGVRDLRAGLVSALYSAAPVRKTLMRAGLGLGLGLSLPTGG